MDFNIFQLLPYANVSIALAKPVECNAITLRINPAVTQPLLTIDTICFYRQLSSPFTQHLLLRYLAVILFDHFG
jgi:hypothetical protein